MPFEIPPGLKPEDEFRHSPKKGAEKLLYGDTLWVSVVDPEANVHGVAHFHLTNNGFARFESLFVIDGVQQLYANKIPLDPKPDKSPWDDGRLKYEVVDPFEHIRITYDGAAYGYDLDFKARFAAFDYDDSLPNGDPLRVAVHFHGGHYEQAMDCTGTFDIRGGPNKGETRKIQCWSHRDHTWSDRFAVEPQWQVKEAHVASHYWPSVQLPDRHINIFGLYFQDGQPSDQRAIGGFVSDENGSRPLRGATAEISPNDGTPAIRDANFFRYAFTMPDGEVIHVRSTKHHGTIKLWLRGENDLENRMDCYEAFVDWEVEETGEVGTGTAEYSVMPAWPQWIV
jgi:hypothetical protein